LAIGQVNVESFLWDRWEVENICDRFVTCVRIFKQVLDEGVIVKGCWILLGSIVIVVGKEKDVFFWEYGVDMGKGWINVIGVECGVEAWLSLHIFGSLVTTVVL